MSKLPKGVDQLPRGVEIHGNQLRISFMFKGKRCREPIDGVAKINKSSIAYAENKRKVILTEIKENRFDYAAHFPASAKAAQFSGYGGQVIGRTVFQGVEQWLKVQEVRKAASTYRNYRHKARHVLDHWGKRRIADIPKSEIEMFQSQLLANGLAPKTVNDIFTVVRGVWGNAYNDGAIQSNPLDRIENIERDSDQNTADPFTREELERIASIKTNRPQDVNMVMFACWSGLSLSELIALSWEDIDTEQWTLKVIRAKVGPQYKVPKERSRVRTVELIAPAIHWLKQQMRYTKLLEPVDITVIERNNVTSREESVRFVFRNGKNQIPWHDPSIRRWYNDILTKAKVRHRGPNQCRHTFASQALSAYVPLEWVARQLGHTDNTMIKKHYGKWIPNDTKSMAGMVSQMMGFEADSGGLEGGNSAPKMSQA
ncbi:Arm DNA-binding domain-containing protein [Marinobacterium stanieri]|uniref:Integrase n=1 Tax=Marinobacterium stanieri TaxID=49186 RepID=A0A1N6QDV3_9GAMM|nr:DUF3596 domain-containing protein [Marinobacterium stanieri]SIQ14809.1 integrase [Marinobacterium stanieri]